MHFLLDFNPCVSLMKQNMYLALKYGSVAALSIVIGRLTFQFLLEVVINIDLLPTCDNLYVLCIQKSLCQLSNNSILVTIICHAHKVIN